MKTRFLASICLVLSLGGCATTTEYGHKISGWIGHSVDDLYSMLGKPSSSEPQADGGKIVSYERTEVVKAAPDAKAAQQHAASLPATAATAEPANTRTVSCTTRYKTDSTGVVRSWTFDGEGCKAHEAAAPQQP